MDMAKVWAVVRSRTGKQLTGHCRQPPEPNRKLRLSDQTNRQMRGEAIQWSGEPGVLEPLISLMPL